MLQAVVGSVHVLRRPHLPLHKHTSDLSMQLVAGVPLPGVPWGPLPRTADPASSSRADACMRPARIPLWLPPTPLHDPWHMLAQLTSNPCKRLNKTHEVGISTGHPITLCVSKLKDANSNLPPKNICPGALLVHEPYLLAKFMSLRAPLQPAAENCSEVKPSSHCVVSRRWHSISVLAFFGLALYGISNVAARSTTFSRVWRQAGRRTALSSKLLTA